MRRPYFAGAQTVRLALADALLTLGSFAIALIIRARFSGYLVTTLDVVVIAPWIVILRMSTIVLLEHYAVLPTTWLAKDATALGFHNAIPTLVLLALRLISPIDFLRLPISVIGMEYAFSTFLMFLYRAALASRRADRPDAEVGYRRRVLLWGEPSDILDLDVIPRLAEDRRLLLVGILSANPMFWDTVVHSLRVFGDESRLSEILLSDDSFSTVCVVVPEREQLGRVRSLLGEVRRFNMEVATYADGTLVLMAPDELERRVKVVCPPRVPVDSERPT